MGSLALRLAHTNASGRQGYATSFARVQHEIMMQRSIRCVIFTCTIANY